MKKTLLAMAVASALAGCAVEPQVITHAVEAKVPVPVPCKTKPVERPAFALDAVSPSDDVYTKGRAALVEIEQRKGYETKLEAANAACQ